MSKVCELKVNNYRHREAILVGLAEAGYRVRVVEKDAEKSQYFGSTAKDMWAVVEEGDVER